MNPWVLLHRFAAYLRYKRKGNEGARGEDLAHLYLRAKGYTIVARNWQPPQGGGELDLVTFEGESLVFVEVKRRASGEVSAPERDIDPDKIAALRRAARDYARRAGHEISSARFDVIAITGERLDHLHDAFPVSL